MALPLIVFGTALFLLPKARWRPLVLWLMYAISVALMPLIGPILENGAQGPGRLIFAEWFGVLFALVWGGVALWRSSAAGRAIRRAAAIVIWLVTLVPGMALVGLAVSCANGLCP